MNPILAVIIALMVLGAAAFVAFRSDDTYNSDSTETTQTERSADEEGDGTSIELGGRALTSVPADVFERKEVRTLNLSQNNLAGALPAEIGHLQELRILDLSDNDFTGVPAEIGQLKNLEALDLSNNPITGLPHELANLSNLRILDLRGTDYLEQDLTAITVGLPPNVDIKVD